MSQHFVICNFAAGRLLQGVGITECLSRECEENTTFKYIYFSTAFQHRMRSSQLFLQFMSILLLWCKVKVQFTDQIGFSL